VRETGLQDIDWTLDFIEKQVENGPSPAAIAAMQAFFEKCFKVQDLAEDADSDSTVEFEAACGFILTARDLIKFAKEWVSLIFRLAMTQDSYQEAMSRVETTEEI
jgi:hypothetical protein